MPVPDESVTVLYTNYRGEKAERRIRPITIWFGSNEYHSMPQWLLRAWCFKKSGFRDFALANVHEWRPFTVSPSK